MRRAKDTTRRRSGENRTASSYHTLPRASEWNLSGPGVVYEGMRPLPLLATLSLLSALATPAISDDLSAPSRVVAVTVYPGAALVERSVEVDLPQGASTVVLADLPASLDAGSLTASGTGSFAIGGVEIRSTPIAGPASERVAGLEARIRELEGLVGVQNEEIQNLESTREFLTRLGVIEREGARRDLEAGRLPATEIGAMATAFVESLRGVSRSLLEARTRKDALERDLRAAREELRRIHSGGGRERVQAAVSVEAERAGRATLRVRYVVPGAGWEPVYEARGRVEEGKVALVYAAMVRQATGEDWENVAVTLSTAKPSLGASVADPRPWFLDPRPVMMRAAYAPSPAVGGLYRERSLGQGQAALSSAVSFPAEEDRSADAVVLDADVRTGIHAAFTLPGRVSIRSDNQPRKVQIAAREIQATFTHRAVPENAERAYLVARFVNTTDLLFLAGRVRAFQGNDFVGEGRVRDVTTGETFEVQLGVDPAVEVSRVILESMTDPSTAFGRDRTRVVRRFAIRLENRRRVPVTVNVWDRLPVSRHDDIRVERTRFSAEPNETRENGLVRWAVPLAPGEKREIEFGWRVEYPGGMNVPGL